MSIQSNKIEQDVEELKKDVKIITTNCLPHIKEDLSKVKTNQDWLMKFFWIVAGSSLGAFLSSLYNLIIK